MRARLVSLLVRPTPAPLALGLVVASSLIVAETLAVYLLKQVAPQNVFGVVYLIGVLVVSIRWGGTDSYRLAHTRTQAAN
jgi:hypothetical protein